MNQELSLELQTKIDNSIDYLLRIKKDLGVDYFYESIPSSIKPSLNEKQIINYWKSINRWKKDGYTDNYIDVVILLGLSKVNLKSMMEKVSERDDHFIDWILACGLIEMLDIKKDWSLSPELIRVAGSKRKIGVI